MTEGREIAGPLVAKACERHLRDLVDGPKRGLKWEWTKPDGSAPRGTGKYVAEFFASELYLAEDKPFILEPPLLFIVGSLFGWKGPDGYRRFRVAYIEIGKGNAKTTLAGGLGIYMLVADGEPRAEVYAAAVDKDQARIPFRDAISFVNLNPRLDEQLKRSGGEGQEWNLAYLRNGSFFRPISSESKGRGKSGFRPHFVILDEIHEHPTAAMVDLAIANLKNRNQPMAFEITNSGVTDPNAVCYITHEHGKRMLEGIDENNDAEFFYICGLDQGDSWLNPAVRKKANPLLGVAVTEKYLDAQVNTAKGMPSKQSVVRRLNFCEWVESSDPFVTAEVWDANGRKIPVELLKGRKCFGGLDLSGKNDLTALVFVFPMNDGTKAVLSFFWTPKDTLRERADRDRAPYQLWVDDGYLVATPGRSIDYEFVARQIGDLNALYDIEGIAFDKHRIEDLERELEKINVEVKLVPHGQTHIDMNPALEALEDDLLEGRLCHGGNPVLKSCIANAKVVPDASTNRKFDKRNSMGRIDGAQSLAMAENLCSFHKPEREADFQLMFV